MKTFFKNIVLFFLMTATLFLACDKKKDKKLEPPVFEMGELKDESGKVYKTIKIGEQWWMAEDLKVAVYRDSTSIKKIDANTQWSEDTAGAFVINSGNYYYNWYALRASKKLAPEGWHIPTDQEWKQLETYLGMASADADKTGWRGNYEGNKLKFGGPFAPGSDEVKQGWKSQSKIDGYFLVNESGFSALANNCRLFDGIYGAPINLTQGFWWTATDLSDKAYYRNLDYKKTSVLRSAVLKNYGFCIRCVKD